MRDREADEALDVWACTRAGRLMGWVFIACSVVCVIALVIHDG